MLKGAGRKQNNKSDIIICVKGENKTMTEKEYFKEMCGYDLITTFWSDFTVAEAFGINSVKETYKLAKEGWKSHYKYMTELTLILNHKIWQHYEKNKTLARVYNDLWEDCNNFCLKNLKGEELQYFLRVLD